MLSGSRDPKGPRAARAIRRPARPPEPPSVPGPPSVGDGLYQVTDILLGQVAGQIGLADDTHQVVAVDHRKPAHLVIGHRPQRHADVVVRAYGHRLSGGQLAGLGLLRVAAL